MDGKLNHLNDPMQAEKFKPLKTRMATRVFMSDADRVVTEYLRHRITEWLQEKPSRSAADLAEAAKLTPGQISLIRSRKSGVGLKSLRGLAVALGESFSDLEPNALAWAKANGIDPSKPVDRYPARVRAIERAKEDGRSERAIQAALAMDGKDAEVLTVDDWTSMIRGFEAALAKPALKLVKRS